MDLFKNRKVLNSSLTNERSHTTRFTLAVGALSAMLLFMVVPAVAASASPGGFTHHHGFGDGRPGYNRNGTVVSIESSPYGSVLVVGGAGAGYDPTSIYADSQGYLYPPGSSLYSPSIDPTALVHGFFGLPYVAGCNATTSATAIVEGGPDTCAGTETDPTADWPALTTVGPPIAGPGVIPFLLGSVYRADLGAYQVTYAGHPLYLFTPGANTFDGEDFFETVEPFLFPWETAWYLVSPNGQFNPGPANLSVVSPQPGSLYKTYELAAEMLPSFGPGGVPVTVYTFSGDSPWRSNCYGACAREFIPVTTTSAPTEQPSVVGPDVNASAVGVITRFDGTRQVTYNGHPLYIYNQEQPLPLASGAVQTVGNGNGVSGFGGTLSFVTP
jgi:predicted lipoprotein with Yx(FWY)xxD motif